MNEESFREAIKNSTVAVIEDENGNIVERLTPDQLGGAGLSGRVPATGPVPIYKVDNGWSMDATDAPKSTVSLDNETGKISVNIPAAALQNETFKNSINKTLNTLSAVYKSNPDYKFRIEHEDGTTDEKSVQDVINDLNAPATNEDGSFNQNSLQYMATVAIGMERIKKAHKENVDLDDNDVIRMNTIAIGPDVNDTTLQLVSNLPEAWWLRNIDTYDEATGFAQYGDIMTNAYNKEKVSSEDMIKLWAALENYFAKGDFSDKEEYIRNVATARFLDATQPNMSWIRDVTENVNGFLNSIGGYATELGTGLNVAREMLFDFFGFEGNLEARDEYYKIYGEDSSNLYVRRGGNQFATDMPLEKVDAKIGRIKFDKDGVPSYVEEKIEGSFENPRTDAETIRAVFKENQAVIRKDIEYLHASQASWDAVGYALTNLAALISAGNLLSDIFTFGAGVMATKATANTIEAATTMADTVSALYASGSALSYGTSAAEVAQIISGLKTIYDIAAVTGKSAMLLNFIGQAVASAKTTELIIGVVGESIAEAIVGDNNRLVEVLKNKEIDTDTKNYLIETYIGNALGWGVGLGVGKFLMKAGETTMGRAISANLSRRIFKIQNAVGDAFDQAFLTIRRVKGDDLVDKIKTLYEEGGRYAKKQANALAASVDLRTMRKAIVDSTDAIEISGKSAEEVKEALADIELKINELKKAEVALTSMQRQGVDIVQGWLKDDGKGLKEVTENFYSKAAEVAKLEKEAGDLFRPTKGAVSNLTNGKTLRLFSQTTTNYIKASEKIDFINAYINKYEHMAGVSQDILAKIRAYREELPELREMVRTFLKNASPDLRLAANNFIDADRKWWAQYENLRARLGLTDVDELKWFRGSGLWGTNGELYARTTRMSDLSEYVVKHRDGSSNVKTFDVYEQYMAGATGDFADPMGEMQIALYDAGSKQAYRSFAKSYNKLTGTAIVKVSGEESALYQKMKKGLRKAYSESSVSLLKGISDEVESNDIIENVIKNLQDKNTQYGDIQKTKGAMKTAVKNMQKKLTDVTSENANKYIVRLGAEDTNALWDDFYDVSVRDLMNDGSDAVPMQARRFIYGQARELGIDIDAQSNFMPIVSNYSSVDDVTSLGTRRALSDLEAEYDIFLNNAKIYQEGSGWTDLDIPDSLDDDVRARLEQFKKDRSATRENAKKHLGFDGEDDEFDSWFEMRKKEYESDKAVLENSIKQLRGTERAPIEFGESLYPSETNPVEYIKGRKTRQKISDSKLGNRQTDSTAANMWLEISEPSAKIEIREAIESDPKLRSALLSTMYDNSGSELPFNEWLDTPITLKRQQVVDSLRSQDAFMSFSMHKDWQGIGGLTQQTVGNEPGDIITLKVRPRDTLGEIPANIEYEDELEVLVPREVYATAMTASEPQNKLVRAYDAVNRTLAGTADTPDATFEQQVKRLIMSHNEDIINDTRVQRALTEKEQYSYFTKNEIFYKEKAEELEFLERQYGITKEEISVAGGTTVRGYIESMTEKGTPQRNAIDELCRYYGLEGDENAIEYFALSAYMDSRSKYKHEIATQIRKAIEEDHPEFTTAQNKKIAGIITNGIDSSIENEFNDARLVIKEINPEATREADEKVMKEVDRIAKEIENAEANRYSGEKNIIAMRNAQGKVEYYQTDPLLARLVNFQYLPEKMNGLTQAVYNTNYLWAKLFRLGTTAINLKSMVAQSFRDPINMFIGGGAYKTTQQCMDDIVDVAGDDIVAWVKTYEPEALGRLQKEAAETGEDIRKLAVEREFAIGEGLSPTTTESWMYRSLNTAKRARLNGVLDIYDDTLGDKTVRAIDKVGETLGKPNEWRETTLRNLSYRNGLSTALKRGYSLDQARTFATFVMNESTTNFTRMTNHLVSLKDTVPYFGSAVNGSKSFFKLLSMDPVGVTGRLVGGIIIPAIALTTYSLLDEKNREIYKNIPEYQKEDAIMFVVDGQIVSIPVPQELSSFIAPFRQMVEGMYDVSTNTFAELAWHDILGFSPVDLTGFANLDFAKLETSSPGFLTRIGDGIARLWSQLAPPVLKSGLEVVTGVDPYTGKAIDKSYTDYDEDGNPIIRDYQSGELAKLLNNMFRSWGLSSSAPVVQNILSNIIGQGSVDIADFLVSLGTQVPNGGWAFPATERQLAMGEGYNPLYVLGERLTDPITMDAYNEAQSAWKTEVTKLYEEKERILKSKEWEDYVKAKRSTSDPDKLKNINASGKNIVSSYYETVKNVVNNLQANYGEEFTAAKFATVLSLMTMDIQTLDLGAYGEYLDKESYKAARSQAIQTMINMGFPSSSSQDVLGKFVTSKDGNIFVRTYSPLAILQLDDVSGSSIYSQSNRQHYAVIRNLLSDGNAYDMREDYYNNVDKAYDAKNYDKVEELMNEYNEKIIRLIYPYIKEYTPESVLQGDVMDYLEDYIMVPSSFMGKGKYYSSKTGLNKQQGYARSYIKAIFNYGENKINGNK